MDPRYYSNPQKFLLTVLDVSSETGGKSQSLPVDPVKISRFYYSSSTPISALIGAVIGVVFFFIPFSPILGGAIAGYLEGGTTNDGMRVGAFAGLIMLIPIGFIGMAAIMLVFGAIYTVGSSWRDYRNRRFPRSLTLWFETVYPDPRQPTGMAIEYRDRREGGPVTVATACPFCDQPIRDQQSLGDHLRAGCNTRE